MDIEKDPFSLPGWDTSYTQEEVKQLMADYWELGAMYLQGIWEGLHVQTKKGKVAT